MFRVSLAIFVAQASFWAFTPILPILLARAGVATQSIGMVLGIAAIIQIPTALITGPLIDRFGPRVPFRLGTFAYLTATAVIGGWAVSPMEPQLVLGVARALQSVGFAMVLPSGLALMAGTVSASQRGVGLALAGSANNVASAAIPLLAIAVLEQHSLLVLALGGAVIAIAGWISIPQGDDRRGVDSLGSVVPLRGLRRDRQWLVPLMLVVLSVPQWGAILAFLPVHASGAGADVGLFFLATGITIVLLRLATGFLISAVTSRALIIAGLSLSFASTLLLLVPPTNLTLLLAGAASGTGAGLLVTPITVELAKRSSRETRGSAYALFAGCHASGIVLGGIGGAVVAPFGGFPAIMLASGSCLIVAAIVAFLDPLLARKGDLPAPPGVV